jgi:hypothetical protein
LDYIQAAVECIELIALLFGKLAKKQRIEDFNPVLQTIIEGVNKGFKAGKFSLKYWEALNNVANWAKGRWNEVPEIESFYKELREKRDYFLMRISSGTNFAHPNETFENIFDEYTAIDNPSIDANEKLTYYSDEEPELDDSDLKSLTMLQFLRLLMKEE